ncbi:MAG: hypothetical protein ACRC0X_06180 [Brevinema sp.]
MKKILLSLCILGTLQCTVSNKENTQSTFLDNIRGSNTLGHKQIVTTSNGNILEGDIVLYFYVEQKDSKTAYYQANTESKGYVGIRIDNKNLILYQKNKLEPWTKMSEVQFTTEHQVDPDPNPDPDSFINNINKITQFYGKEIKVSQDGSFRARLTNFTLIEEQAPDSAIYSVAQIGSPVKYVGLKIVNNSIILFNNNDRWTSIQDVKFENPYKFSGSYLNAFLTKLENARNLEFHTIPTTISAHSSNSGSFVIRGIDIGPRLTNPQYTTNYMLLVEGSDTGIYSVGENQYIGIKLNNNNKLTLYQKNKSTPWSSAKDVSFSTTHEFGGFDEFFWEKRSTSPTFSSFNGDKGFFVDAIYKRAMYSDAEKIKYMCTSNPWRAVSSVDFPHTRNPKMVVKDGRTILTGFDNSYNRINFYNPPSASGWTPYIRYTYPSNPPTGGIEYAIDSYNNVTYLFVKTSNSKLELLRSVSGVFNKITEITVNSTYGAKIKKIHVLNDQKIYLTYYDGNTPTQNIKIALWDGRRIIDVATLPTTWIDSTVDNGLLYVTYRQNSTLFVKSTSATSLQTIGSLSTSAYSHYIAVRQGHIYIASAEPNNKVDIFHYRNSRLEPIKTLSLPRSQTYTDTIGFDTDLKGNLSIVIQNSSRQFELYEFSRFAQP